MPSTKHNLNNITGPFTSFMQQLLEVVPTAQYEDNDSEYDDDESASKKIQSNMTTKIQCLFKCTNKKFFAHNYYFLTVYSNKTEKNPKYN